MDITTRRPLAVLRRWCGALALCLALPAVAGGPAAAANTAPADTKEATPVYILMETSMGEVVLELNKAKAPVSVKNFVNYTEKGAYDGTVFHRVIPGFMAQGGGFEPSGVQRDADKPIKNEAGNGLPNDRGTIAMARTSDPDSATSQFFINVKDNAFLNRGGHTPGDTSDDTGSDAGYAVFGKVVKGMDVVDKIVAVPTETKRVQGYPMGDWPAQDVVIKKVTVLSKAEADKKLGRGELKPASAGSTDARDRQSPSEHNIPENGAGG